MSWHARDIALFGLLIGFGVVVVEISRRSAPAEPAGLIKDVIAAWLLPTAILLPPLYGLAASALTFALLQGRARRTIVHRRAFSGAAYGLTSAAVSAGFHAVPVTPNHTLWWLLAAVIAAVAWLTIGTALVGIAGCLADRTISVREELLAMAPLLNDMCELSAGVLIAGLIAGVGWGLLLPALPLVVVLQRSFRAVQLDTRRDALTGLLGSAAWRSETEVQFARARRTGSPLTIGVVHLDLTDSHGYLARDTALVTAATAVRASLRPYDLTGRVGQQIVFTLPDTMADEARQIAIRLRDGLAAHLDAAEPGQQPACVAVTLGLAVTDAPAHTDVDGMLASADAALSRAKRAGQHHVCLDTIPATSDETVPGTGSASGDVEDDLAAAFRARGALLRGYRKARGFTQEALRRRTSYGRSTIADVESEDCDTVYSPELWEACDHVLNAKGELIAANARVEALKARVDARRRAAEQDQRQRAAAPEHTGPPASGFSLVDGACPHCGWSLAGVHVTARITGVLGQDLHLPD